MRDIKPVSKILEMSVSEEEFMLTAYKTLNEIENKIRALEDEKHELLKTIHIAKTYYKYKKEKPHTPTREELDEMFGDGQ